jgi:hypothetical protein
MVADPDMARVDTGHPGKVGDKAQAGPVAAVAEAGGAVDGAPAILAARVPLADPARRATTRMAFTPRPWTTVIAPR